MTYLALISFILVKLDKVLNSEERPENENSTFSKIHWSNRNRNWKNKRMRNTINRKTHKNWRKDRKEIVKTGR